MVIPMSTEKTKAIRVSENVHLELIKLKYELKKRSLNEVIEFLLEMYRKCSKEGTDH